MEKFRFDRSLTNIPIPPKTAFEKHLLVKTCDFYERLRWKAFFELNPHASRDPIRTHGFKTDKAAPQIKELAAFEKDLFQLVTNIEYRQHTENAFQKELASSVKEINKSDKIFLLADKTTNIYKVSPEQYNKLLTENITKDYKSSTEGAVHACNQQASKIAHTLKLERRIEAQSENSAYITLKDHKEDFRDRPKCRLINPAKSEIGKISKQLLEEINMKIRIKTGLQQWRSTSEVLSWFNTLPHKNNLKFLQLDIVEFYPSITQTLLNKAFAFAEHVLGIPIAKQTREIVQHARQSFLFSLNHADPDNPKPWVKKSGTFDVTMGAPDGAEVCELVGLFLINETKSKFPELNFGLYRDDGLATYGKMPARKADRVRKDLHSLFGQHDLKITIELGTTSCNFLDVTLDLKENTHAPYRKPNDTPLYVHVDSNHPPNVIREIPNSINARLNSISSNRQTFDEAVPAYQQALDKSGHKHTLTYKEEVNTNSQSKQTNKKKKKRHIVWFNPPYNKAVKTNIGKRFLALIDKHFPPQHRLRKIINRNCVKISYSCTKNVRAIIQAHNNKILSKHSDRGNSVSKQTYTEGNMENTTPKQIHTQENTGNTIPKQAHPLEKKTCNCRAKAECVVNNQCKSGPLIYRATVKSGTQDTHTYVGCTEDFKQRYSNHKQSFKNGSRRNETVLSQHIWNKGLNPSPEITWEVLKHAQTYRRGNRFCDLCTTEKLLIAKELRHPYCLNKRTDFTNACVHKAKHKLCKIKPK